MAEVKIVPKIQCDNCGAVAEKTGHESYMAGKVGINYQKPRDWGGCRIEGHRDADAYGGKARLDMTDLCPKCAEALIVAASRTLADRRREDA